MASKCIIPGMTVVGVVNHFSTLDTCRVSCRCCSQRACVLGNNVVPCRRPSVDELRVRPAWRPPGNAADNESVQEDSGRPCASVASSGLMPPMSPCFQPPRDLANASACLCAYPSGYPATQGGQKLPVICKCIRTPSIASTLIRRGSVPCSTRIHSCASPVLLEATMHQC
jgi:hypothetical protein